MPDIKRLDYSNPPPGYLGGRSDAAYLGATPEESLAAAWAHYKERHDPPGMRVLRATILQGFILQDVWGLYLLDSVEHVIWCDSQVDARAAAWTGYDCRLALAARVLREVVTARERLYDGLNVGLPSTRTPLDVWPRCLTWSDAQVSEVERWLDGSTATTPEVLRA